MARSDIYHKQGKLSYKEQRLIDRLDATIREKQISDPTFKIEKANSFEELKALHDKHCIQDVDYHEIKNDKTDAAAGDKPAETVDTETVEGTGSTEPKKTIIDPLNDESPVVNDYVMDNQQQTEQNSGQTQQTSNFSEPTTFDEAFHIPVDENNGGNKGNSQQSQTFGPSQQRGPSSGPSMDGNSAGRRRRSTKKLAAYIVKIACVLIEKGYIYIVTKDITEAKLMQAQLRGEIDLSLMVQLTDGQIAPISQFFKDMRLDAVNESKVDPEAAADLTDALTDLLFEKEIHPTPAQEVMLISASIVVPMGLQAFAKSSHINDVLAQLKAMSGPTQPFEEVKTPAPQPQPVQTPVEESFETATASAPAQPISNEPEPLITPEDEKVVDTPE